jgi:hypothetical protein
MNLIDYIALLAGIATLLSLCGNLIQWRTRHSLVRALRARSQAAYNYFYSIAYRADAIRELAESDGGSIEDKFQIAIRQAYAITGAADAARSDIIAYCREHLNSVPIEEHPANPLSGQLPRPGSREKFETVDKDYARWGKEGKRS